MLKRVSTLLLPILIATNLIGSQPSPSNSSSTQKPTEQQRRLTAAREMNLDGTEMSDNWPTRALSYNPTVSPRAHAFGHDSIVASILSNLNYIELRKVARTSATFDRVAQAFMRFQKPEDWVQAASLILNDRQPLLSSIAKIVAQCGRSPNGVAEIESVVETFQANLFAGTEFELDEIQKLQRLCQEERNLIARTRSTSMPSPDKERLAALQKEISSLRTALNEALADQRPYGLASLIHHQINPAFSVNAIPFCGIHPEGVDHWLAGHHGAACDSLYRSTIDLIQNVLPTMYDCISSQQAPFHRQDERVGKAKKQLKKLLQTVPTELCDTMEPCAGLSPDCLADADWRLAFAKRRCAQLRAVAKNESQRSIPNDFYESCLKQESELETLLELAIDGGEANAAFWCGDAKEFDHLTKLAAHILNKIEAGFCEPLDGYEKIIESFSHFQSVEQMERCIERMEPFRGDPRLKQIIAYIERRIKIAPALRLSELKLVVAMCAAVLTNEEDPMDPTKPEQRKFVKKLLHYVALGFDQFGDALFGRAQRNLDDGSHPLFEFGIVAAAVAGTYFNEGNRAEAQHYNRMGVKFLSESLKRFVAVRADAFPMRHLEEWKQLFVPCPTEIADDSQIKKIRIQQYVAQTELQPIFDQYRMAVDTKIAELKAIEQEKKRQAELAAQQKADEAQRAQEEAQKKRELEEAARAAQAEAQRASMATLLATFEAGDSISGWY